MNPRRKLRRVLTILGAFGTLSSGINAQAFLECDPSMPVKALSFDGASDYVRIAYSPTFPVAEFTVTAWIRTTDAVANIVAYGEDDVTDKKPWAMVLVDGELELSMENDADNTIQYSSGAYVANGEWRHVAVTRDFAGNVAFFVDGASVASFPNKGNPSRNSVQDLTIGCLLGSSGGGLPQLPLEFLDGQVGEVSLWSEALSPSEIGSVYESHVGVFLPSLVGWWRFQEGSGQIVRDQSLQGISGVLGGDGSVAADDPVRVVGLFCPLSALGSELSVSSGGGLTYSLEAGAEHGIELYFLLGSVTGTSPGIPLGSITLPLNADAYFQHTLLFPNSPPLTSSLGILESDGSAQAVFALPAGFEASLAGIQFHHAYVAMDVFGTGAVTLASNAVPLTLVP